MEHVIPPFILPFQQIIAEAEIQEVMRSPDFLQGRSPERDLFFGGSLVMIDGESHLERKKLFSSLFSKSTLAFYETQLLEPVINDVLREFSTDRGPDGLVRMDLAPLVRVMLHRIAARVTGIDGVDTAERTERFRVAIAKLAEATAGQWSTKDREQLIKDGLAARKVLIDEFLAPSFQRRRDLVAQIRAGDLQKEGLPKDLLSLIAMHGTPDEVGDTGYDAYVWRECTLFLTASTQTTTHSLPNVVAHIDEWTTEHPEDADRVQDPDFLRLAVGESLRLHQTAPVKMRIAAKDLTLSTGRKVAKDEQVALFAPYANMEEQLFGSDAKTFNPYRKLAPGMQPWGLTFGSGAHSCLGRNLVTGLMNRSDDKSGADGTIVKMLRVFYAAGMQLDRANPPQRNEASFHDAFETMPIILRNL